MTGYKFCPALHELHAKLVWHAHAAAGDIMDGDFLAQLENLPEGRAQALLDSIDRNMVAQLMEPDSMLDTDAILASCGSLRSVLQILERSLSVLWPP